ncbi:hypothetical protein [Oceaniglobus roseus]|uniref:hypothetical protein n=1 Tax=Oceaniglobus roseus TaxID=1737570 RepID=UPI000C7ED03C|nr:hypothetical protein [Kandeliimicrobium roseum]
MIPRFPAPLRPDLLLIAAMIAAVAPRGATAREAFVPLIGASECLSPDERFRLKGPPNDVDPMRRNLRGNILYVGSDYSISFMDKGRLLPGDRLDQDFILITDAAFGRDRMVVVLTPATPQSEVEDLSFLAQPAVERTRAAPIAAREGLAGLLEQAGFGETTRAAVSLKSRRAARAPSPAFLEFEIDTVPGR